MMKVAVWCLLLGYLVISFSFVSDKRNELPIKQINVKILDQQNAEFVNNSDVLKMVKKALPNWQYLSMVKVDKNKLEKQIENNPFVEKAEVYGLISGDMVVEIKQCEPIARVIADKSFYIDSEGSRIPLSRNFTSRQLVVSGDVNKKTLSDSFIEMINYIHDHKFWHSQIAQIHIDKKGELILIPIVGSHKIEFGTVKNYEKKFRNLLALYEKGFSQTGWNKYSKINLKYSNQVVCTKR